MSNMPAINIPPQGRSIAVVGDVYRCMATGNDTDGSCVLWEALESGKSRRPSLPPSP